MSVPQDNHPDAIPSAVLETTDDMICVVDAEDFCLLTFNSALARYLESRYGKTPRLGDRLEEIFDAENVAVWRGFFRRAIDEGPFSVAYRGLGGSRPLWLSFNRLVRDGRCFAISSFARDLTPFEQAVQAAQSAEDRFAKVFRHIPYPLLVTTADRGIIVHANNALATLVGRERPDLIGRCTREIGLWLEESDRALLVETMRKEGRVTNFSIPYRRPDGLLLHGLLAAEAVKLDGVDCFLVSVADITPLRNAEQALRESELRYRALIENAPDAIVLIDADSGQHVDANANAARYLGPGEVTLLDAESASARLPSRPESASSSQSLREHIARAADGETLVFEWSRPKSDGKADNLEVRMSPFPDPTRRLVRASIIDIEDRKRAEREAAQLRTQLEQAQRLDSLGTLAGGIAHDFNNILCAIVGYAELALMRETDAQVRSFVENIERGADRAKELVSQILAFSRQTPHEEGPVHVAGVVKEAVRLLRAALPATVTVNQRFDSMGFVMTNPIQIHQIVMNLGTNAGLAMREHGGTMDVAVTEIDIDAQAAALHPGLQPGRYLSLAVSDTGCGIAPENIERIFEPFFTTRHKGEGTGLGLSVVYGIVKKARGTIRVKSEQGLGTTFEVLLPLCPPGAATDVPKATRKLLGGLRVLFVDDDPSIVRMARISLDQLGYRVSTFTDPSQAIEEFGKRAEEFDVLVTDATMPGISGSTLAAVIKKIRPDLPMILVSGTEEQLGPEEAERAGFKACLSKPYRPTALAQIIQDLGDGRTATRQSS
jgi:two-component system, cell cycle sensor histidine kinase and response regulator CckA